MKNKIIALAIILTYVITTFCVSVLAAANSKDIPFVEEFSTEGYVPLETDGYTLTNGTGGTEITGEIRVENGALTLLNAPDPAVNKPNAYVYTNFNKVTSGILVAEADLTVANGRVIGVDGLFALFSEDGKMVAAIQADGRGANGGRVYENGAWKSAPKLNNDGWMPNVHFRFKFEADMDNKTYQMYQGIVNDTTGEVNYKKMSYTDGSTIVDTFPMNASVDNIAKFRQTLSMSGDKIDNIRVYKKITAIQGQNKIEIVKGGQKQAEITFAPATETMGDMVWTSSDTGIVTVSPSGLVTGVSAGTAKITAVSRIYGVNFTYNVTVAEPATGLSLNKSSVTINRDSAVKLTYSAIPDNSTPGDISWASSAPEIATVDSDGNVVGVSEGEAIITARGTIGGVSAQCCVKVVVPVTSMSVSPSAATMNYGGRTALTAVILPDEASAVEKKWISENPYIATVDSNGVVTATGEGSTKIFASCDGFYAYCTVTVNGNSGDNSIKRPYLISFIKDMGYETPELGEQIITADKFVDLASVEWAQEAVLNMLQRKIMNADSANEFGASIDITRGEFVSVLIKALKLENKSGEVENKVFEDVTEEHKFYPYIMKAAELGIIKGSSDTEFAPDEEITRQDMAVVIYNSMSVSGINMKLAAPNFADNNIIAAYAKKSVGSLAGMGVIAGKPDGFDPLANVTRAEAAVLADRIIKLK